MADDPLLTTTAAGDVPEHIPYSITSQIKSETFTPDGRFQVVWRVGFDGPHGLHSYVEIPDSVYSPAELDRRVQAELDRMVGAHELGPQPHPDNAA